VSEALEERVAKMEGILDQVDKRLGGVESELRDLREETRAEIRGLREELRGEIGELRGEISGLREKMESGIEGLRKEMKEEIGELRGEIRKMDDRFYTFMKWIIAALIGSWATLMAAILTLMLK